MYVRQDQEVKLAESAIYEHLNGQSAHEVLNFYSNWPLLYLLFIYYFILQTL